MMILMTFFGIFSNRYYLFSKNGGLSPNPPSYLRPRQQFIFGYYSLYWILKTFVHVTYNRGEGGDMIFISWAYYSKRDKLTLTVDKLAHEAPIFQNIWLHTWLEFLKNANSKFKSFKMVKMTFQFKQYIFTKKIALKKI